MSRAPAVRHVKTAAGYGVGRLVLASFVLLTLLLVAEAKLARWIVGKPYEAAPRTDGVYGSGSDEPLSLVVLGDSVAASMGVREQHEAVATFLATGLSSASRRSVRLTSVARSGARSAELEGQVTEALGAHPDAAVIVIGGNDVMRRTPPRVALRHMRRAVRRLREAGCQVVVGTCPDLGTIQPIQQPLRTLVRHASRVFAAAQTVAVVEAGGRAVSLGDVLGPAFRAAPREMFGPDRFHPSPRGYASAAAALLPAVCVELGLWSETETLREPVRGSSVLPIPLAAAEAAEKPGTEVAASGEVPRHRRDPRGPWARVLRPRRRHRALPDTAAGLQSAEQGARLREEAGWPTP